MYRLGIVTSIVFSVYIILAFDSNKFMSKNVHSKLQLELFKKLQNEIYHLSVKKNGYLDNLYQSIERFDLIFVGRNINPHVTKNNKLQNLSALIPGHYTHVMMYIGKDINGFAYGIEMNIVKGGELNIRLSGVEVEGGLYLNCLGSDYGKRPCPKGSYVYGMDSYDYVLAKRLNLRLIEQVHEHEQDLMNVIEQDLQDGHYFQIPFAIDLETITNKTIKILNESRSAGSDCASYMVELLEENALVCLDDIRMDAKELMQYYLDDRIGRTAVIPKEYNLILHQTISVNKLLLDLDYKIIDDAPHKTKCLEEKSVHGIVMPNLIFKSPSLIPIKVIDPKQ